MKPEVDKYFEENAPQADLGRATARSGITIVAARGVNVFVQVASTVLLARLLNPLEFGLAALVLTLVGCAPILTDLGTTDASIQRSRIAHGDISALFWLNISIGLLLTILFAASSGFIAWFFSEPALTGISLVSSLTFVLSALPIQHYALMRRAMQFRRIAIIEISANVIGSVVGVAMALTGWGYWALVAKPLLTSGLIAVGAWMSCPWLPGRPRVTAGVKEMVGFGLGVTGFTVTDYLARSADRVALGYFYGPGPLGYFQNAFLLYGNLLALLTDPLHNVATSSLSKLRDNADELKRAWATAQTALSFIAAPAFAVLAVTGQDVVVILLGQKWEPAGPLLCIFAVRGIANSVERTLGWIHVVAGRSDRWMRWGLFSAVCQLVAVAAGLPFGPIGVAVAYAIAMFGLFVPALAYAGHPVGIGARDVVSAVGPQMAAALIAVAVGFGVQQAYLAEFSPLTRIFMSAALCLATYLAIVVGVFRVTAPLKLAFSLLRDFGPRKFRGNSQP